MADIGDLVGLTLRAINRAEYSLAFHLQDGRTLVMEHEQDCCEEVWLEEVVGDLADLIGTPILYASARESSSGDGTREPSQTWTFYAIRTIRGSVDLRWYGTSNGCYSESVDLRWAS